MKQILIFLFCLLTHLVYSQDQVIELCDDSLKTFTYYAPGTPNCVYNWSVFLAGSLVKTYQGERLELNFKKAGDYKLEVYSENELCQSEVEKYHVQVIECRMPAVYIVNAFTPNGDGLNDIWIPKYSYITSVNLQIYNRWGQLIFQTNQFDKGWDGTVGGNPCPTGSYVWQIEYLTIKGNYFSKAGDVILYR
jgi:gliding motility-associated-like protein